MQAEHTGGAALVAGVLLFGLLGLALDADGCWRVVYPPDSDSATMAADIDQLLGN